MKMSQSKLMSFFSSATEKRKRDSDDSDESQPGPSTPKKTSSDIYNDTTSISCKRSVCDPLKLKMTPKVNYLGVIMIPENFFEGKTLGEGYNAPPPYDQNMTDHRTCIKPGTDYLIIAIYATVSSSL